MERLNANVLRPRARARFRVPIALLVCWTLFLGLNPLAPTVDAGDGAQPAQQAGGAVDGSALFPFVANTQDVVTGIQIQNRSRSDAANISTAVFRQGGGFMDILSFPAIQIGAAANIYLPSRSTVPQGIYSANANSGTSIAGISRTDWFRTGAAAAHGNVRVGTDVRIPLVTRNFYGQSSMITIHNPSASSAASVELEFIASDDATNRTKRTVEIELGRSHTIDLGTDPEFAGLGDRFLGAVAIRNPMGIGAQSFLMSGSAGSPISAFEARPLESADETLYAPLIRNDFYGTTGISVHNPGGEALDVTVEYHGAQGACAGQTFQHGPATIDAGSSSVFYQGNVEVDGTGTSPLPRGCVGSAVIRSDAGPIVAVVNDAGDGTAAAYNAVSRNDGGNLVALPLVRRRHIDALKLTTGIQVMNVGEETAYFDLDVYSSDGVDLGGCGSACYARVEPFQSETFFPSAAVNVLPEGSFGSAVVSSSGAPIVVLVNDASEIGAIDSASYMGIKIE